MGRTEKIVGALVSLAFASTVAQGVTYSETHSDEFELAKVEGVRKLIVDNVWGGIRVVGRAPGTGSNAVRLKLAKRIEADSADWLERAKTEVELQVYREPGVLEFFVDGPWRSRRDRHEWAQHSTDVRYEAIYDFEIEVPGDTDVWVKTVDEGDVEVAKVRGFHDVSNVTGEVRIREVGGAGRFETVSGSVSGTFLGQPQGRSKWKTVSGDVEVVVATKWGEIWSEFRVDPLPPLPPTTTRKKGKFVIKGDSGARFRVGGGGPELRFETLSGDIKIRKAKGD